MIFFEFPDVEMVISISPGEYNASKFLEKSFSKEKSFAHAVIVEVSCAKDIIGKGLLFTFGLSLTKNSAAKCCASAAEPPFPHIKTFFFLLKYLKF